METLECSVCLDTADTSPIYQCPEGHLNCEVRPLTIMSIQNLCDSKGLQCKDGRVSPVWSFSYECSQPHSRSPGSEADPVKGRPSEEHSAKPGAPGHG